MNSESMRILLMKKILFEKNRMNNIVKLNVSSARAVCMPDVL